MQYSLILLLLLPLQSLCQHATVSATKMNVLYIGVNNPVSFAVENKKCSELTLAVEKGTATKTGDCSYDVRVEKPGSTCIFIIKGNDTIHKTEYRVKYIPDPIATCGKPGHWGKGGIRSQLGVSIDLGNFDFDAGFSIVSYEITVLRHKKKGGPGTGYCSECFKKIEAGDNEVVFSAKNQGAYFNDVVKDFIQQKLKVGDRVYFEEIKARGPDGRVRKLNPISILVD